MKERRVILPYALEDVPRPGAREICIRRPPDGFKVRNERRMTLEARAEE